MLRWEENVKMYIKGIGCEDTDWIKMTQGRVLGRKPVNMMINFLVP
jgi:hypothetical protein